MSNDPPITALAEPGDFASDYNAEAFLVEQIIGRLATTTLVKVKAVSNNSEVAAVGTVDVVPMIYQVNGAGVPVESDVPIYSLPYFRLQGGANAIIIDPKVGDIGAAIFCSRDISVVKRNKAPGVPGSARQYDWADGLYIGGFLNGIPVQYFRFTSDNKIEIVSPTQITLQAPTIALINSNGAVILGPDGNATVQHDLVIGGDNNVVGEVTAMAGTPGAIPLSTHLTTGVQSGGGESGPPVAP